MKLTHVFFIVFSNFLFCKVVAQDFIEFQFGLKPNSHMVGLAQHYRAMWQKSIHSSLILEYKFGLAIDEKPVWTNNDEIENFNFGGYLFGVGGLYQIFTRDTDKFNLFTGFSFNGIFFTASTSTNSDPSLHVRPFIEFPVKLQVRTAYFIGNKWSFTYVPSIFPALRGALVSSNTANQSIVFHNLLIGYVIKTDGKLLNFDRIKFNTN